LLGSVVDLELKINRLQGKWKLSQHQPQKNQQSVVKSLLSEGLDVQTQMVLLVQSNGIK
jgi:transcriptional regulator